MNHGKLSRSLAKGLSVLRQRIDAAKIPSSKLDESLNLATWNIREFGRTSRWEESCHYIAEILNQFDLIAVTELRANLKDLKTVLEILGPFWRVVYSDYNPDSPGNDERTAYVFDTRMVDFTGLAAEADPVRTKVDGKYISEFTWWRSPYMASFRAGNFDFVVLTSHIRFQAVRDRIVPLKGLASWVADRAKDERHVDKDIIVVGDFNVPSRRSAAYTALTSEGLKLPAGLMSKEARTNVKRDKSFDQILHQATDPTRFTNRGGVLDFAKGGHMALFPGRKKFTHSAFTFQLSDHLPLWIQLDCDIDGQRLEQLLNAPVRVGG